MHIFLYGPSGSGKSTVGNALAKALNLPFVDLDAEIETRYWTNYSGVHGRTRRERFS